ncbi:MAG: YqaE/Pmp3 family membrane protein [Anaerolineae bacterium]|nr:YqaE/Pmp3 family membrane protein [Anaerolineae bacterium]
MSCLRILLAILLPPLAVLDKGCGAILVVILLTTMGWIPGVIGALVLGSMNPA